MIILTIRKTSIRFLIGTPIFLLLLTIVLTGMSGNEEESTKYNPYLKKMPQKYAALISNVKINDSVFFCGIEKNHGLRELIIFKKFPNEDELKTGFTVELYPSNKKHLKVNIKPLILNITKNAVLFNYDKSDYGIFKKALPIINIEKIIIKQKPIKKNELKWTKTIEHPFDNLPDLKKEFSKADKNIQLTLPNPYSFIYEKALKQNNIEILPSAFKIRNDSLFKKYEDIAKYSIKAGHTIGKVKNPVRFWKSVNTFDKSIIKQIEFYGNNTTPQYDLINRFFKKEIPFSAVFDISKLAVYNALQKVFCKESYGEPIFFFYNKSSKLLEPLYVNSNHLGVVNRNIEKSYIEDVNYLNNYIKALYNFSQFNFRNEIIEDNKLFLEELALINHFDANTIFDFDVIKANQQVIAKSLNPSIALKTELISINKERMTISVFNTSNYPIYILGLNHIDKKEIVTLDNSVQLLSDQKDTIVIDLPRSFENLFVNKKKKTIGFVLPKHIYELRIKYRLLGLNKLYDSAIVPYQEDEVKGEDLFRTKTFINNHKDIIVNEEKREITFSKDSIVISSPLIIPKGYIFKLSQGSIINIINGGKIISYSPLSFIGTNHNPIQIISSDKKGQGMLILAEGENSNMRFVNFIDLTNPKHGSWSVTGAVTFYESPINLESVSIKNNRSEDALNIVRTKFKMNNCSISNTQSDAFDGDFVVGTISNSSFNDLGNDAIDVSGSDLIVEGVNIVKAGDKGLSAGENSKMKIVNVNVSNSEIAIAGKDLSIVEAKKLKISNSKLGFTAFQKKPEFGPSSITVNGIEMTGVETSYLIESASSLFIDGNKIETTQNVKDRMYGVEFGISSEETRNSQ